MCTVSLTSTSIIALHCPLSLLLQGLLLSLPRIDHLHRPIVQRPLLLLHAAWLHVRSEYYPITTNFFPPLFRTIVSYVFPFLPLSTCLPAISTVRPSTAHHHQPHATRTRAISQLFFNMLQPVLMMIRIYQIANRLFSSLATIITEYNTMRIFSSLLRMAMQ